MFQFSISLLLSCKNGRFLINQSTCSNSIYFINSDKYAVYLLLTVIFKLCPSQSLSYVFFLNLFLEWNYFTVIYDVGDPLNASMPFPQTFTVIKFQCNHSAKWQETEDHKVPFQPVNITANTFGKV